MMDGLARSLKPGESIDYEGVKITLEHSRAGRATLRLVKQVATANAVKEIHERDARHSKGQTSPSHGH